jgi:hypothetical protein
MQRTQQDCGQDEACSTLNAQVQLAFGVSNTGIAKDLNALYWCPYRTASTHLRPPTAHRS